MNIRILTEEVRLLDDAELDTISGGNFGLTFLEGYMAVLDGANGKIFTVLDYVANPPKPTLEPPKGCPK